MFETSIAFQNGHWLPFHDLHWSTTDLGTTQGAMLVERLRTFEGKVYSLEEHLSRLKDGAHKLEIPWPPRDLSVRDLVRELIFRNRPLIEKESDVGIVLLLSPGDPGLEKSRKLTPTFMAHLGPIPFSHLAKWYRHGVSLHISSTRNVPSECWSPSIKTRSRLQYYLADRRVPGNSQREPIPETSDSTTPEESIAVLLNTRDCVTETSIANLLLLGNDGVLRSPPLQDILIGTSLIETAELADLIHQPFEYTELAASSLLEAQEVLMTGTTGCIWSAVSVNGKPIANGLPGQLCKKLQDAWREKIGFDFVGQAIERSERT